MPISNILTQPTQESSTKKGNFGARAMWILRKRKSSFLWQLRNLIDQSVRGKNCLINYYYHQLFIPFFLSTKVKPKTLKKQTRINRNLKEYIMQHHALEVNFIPTFVEPLLYCLLHIASKPTLNFIKHEIKGFSTKKKAILLNIFNYLFF